MKKNVKIFLIFIMLIYSFSFFSDYSYVFEDLNLNPFDYARITDVDYKGVVVDEPGSNGKIVVTERITFDIHAASKNNLFWELWRDLPESYVDGVKVDYTVNSVKQILDDGTEIIYEESPKLYWYDSDYLSSSTLYGPGKWYHSEGPYNEYHRQYECVFFYVDGLYRENVTFEIEYEMNNAALRYGDCSELYLSFYSEDTIKYLNSFNAQILIADNDMPSSGNYEAHTYGTSVHEFAYTESDTLNPGYHTFSISLDKSDLKFKPYNEYLEFSLISYGADSHKFTDYASRNDYYYDDGVLEELRAEQEEYESIPKIYAEKKLKILFICSIIAILVVLYTIRKIRKTKKENIFYSPTIQVDYFREIPSNLDPAFASKLVFCKHKFNLKKNNADSYSSILLSLVRKGYISIEKIDSSKDLSFENVKMVITCKKTPVTNNLNSTDLAKLSNQVDINELQSMLSNSTLDTDVVLQNISNNLNETSNSNTDSSNDFNIDNNSMQYSNMANNDLEPLTEAEASYFNLIVRHSNAREISMKEFQQKVSTDYENTNSFVETIENSTVNIGISGGYFQKADFEAPKRKLKNISTLYILIGIIFITFMNFVSYMTLLDFAFGAFTILGITFIICAIILRLFARKCVLLTQFGEDEYAKWRGLYNFLNSETLMNERTVVELPLWEQYLVYATAFGISKKVIAALKLRCPDIETSQMLSNPYFYSRSFYHSSRSFRVATRSASHVARSGGYGSFGGHGGYGGGGRGGGGGRRRSLIKIFLL